MAETMLPAEPEPLLGGDVVTFDLTHPPYEFANPYGVTASLSAPMAVRGQIVGLLALDCQDPVGGAQAFTDAKRAGETSTF